jgi:NADH-quinone oxidoreductase subunit E
MDDTACSVGLRLTQPEAEDLIAHLQRIQADFHYLPERVLIAVARQYRVPLTEVFHIATFYNCFTLEPRGRHRVQVCQGTACHVRGGQQVVNKILRDLRLFEPGTTADLEFSVEPVRCLGCCGLAPVMRVDQRTYGHLQPARIPGILKCYRVPSKPVEGTASKVLPQPLARAS